MPGTTRQPLVQKRSASDVKGMKTALVLSGGGARGAYSAGVLRYIFGVLGPELGDKLRVDVISGNSAGALNGCWLAGHGWSPTSVDRLSAMWQSLQVADVYTFDARMLFKTPLKVLQRAGKTKANHALLDAKPLKRLIEESFPWEGLRERIDSGALEALVISSTQVGTGRHVMWVDKKSKKRLRNPDPTAEVRQVQITTEHCLASSAIPFVFPPVQIGEELHVDGMLRHNTPLSPAHMLGCERILVINVKRAFPKRIRKPKGKSEAPNLAFLMGKALNALLLDPAEKDLQHAQRESQIIDYGIQKYGQEFLTGLNEAIKDAAPFRQVRTLILRPESDLGRVAADVWAKKDIQLTRTTRILLSHIAEKEGIKEADFLSYLLFDSAYTAAIERKGFNDTKARRDELIAFFTAP
jgi:NTE family protein